MSDLQCPATLLVSRHGDALYAVDGVPSDDGGALTDKGRKQVRHLVEQVRSRRVAAVYSSRMERAVQSAELAASQLGLQPIVVDGLQELSVGDLAVVSSQDPRGSQDPRAQKIFDGWLQGDLDAAYPGGEDGHAVLKRFAGAVEEIADSHRGETVLVFTHSSVMSLVIPRVGVNVPNDLAAQYIPPHCAPAEVAVDADGWRIVSWPGSVGSEQA